MMARPILSKDSARTVSSPKSKDNRVENRGDRTNALGNKSGRISSDSSLEWIRGIPKRDLIKFQVDA